MNQNVKPRLTEHKAVQTGAIVFISVLLAVLISAVIAHQKISKLLKTRLDSIENVQARLDSSMNDCYERLQQQTLMLDSIKNDIYSASHDSVSSTAMLLRIQNQLDESKKIMNARLSVIEKRHEHICESVDHIRKEFKQVEAGLDKQYSELVKNDRQIKNSMDALDRKFEELERRADF